MSFLNAEWRKLALANYVVEPEILLDHVPNGTELDLWDNQCYVSLVGFMFLNTRLLGLKVPWHVNFEEVNLRFYVRRKSGDDWKRGVVFIKEIVPKSAITFVANTVYKEKYETMKMDHKWQETDDSLLVQYSWRKQNKWFNFDVKAEKGLTPIHPGSEEEFITEHYWGYARVGESKTNEYEVTHPRWEHHRVKDYKINVDFGLVYGDQFKFLNDQTPNSIMLAEGSEISVESKRSIA